MPKAPETGERMFKQEMAFKIKSELSFGQAAESIRLLTRKRVYCVMGLELKLCLPPV